MQGCDQATITGAGFSYLKGINALGMNGCDNVQVAIARSLGLPVNTRSWTSVGALHYTFDEREGGS